MCVFVDFYVASCLECHVVVFCTFSPLIRLPRCVSLPRYLVKLVSPCVYIALVFSYPCALLPVLLPFFLFFFFCFFLFIKHPSHLDHRLCLFTPNMTVAISDILLFMISDIYNPLKKLQWPSPNWHPKLSQSTAPWLVAVCCCGLGRSVHQGRIAASNLKWLMEHCTVSWT